MTGTKHLCIAWHVGAPDRNWACGHLVNHLIEALPDLDHVIDPDPVADAAADVRVFTLAPHLVRIGPDRRTIIHLDGQRWMGPLAGHRPPRIVHIYCPVFMLDKWSFGLTGMDQFYRAAQHPPAGLAYEFIPADFYWFRDQINSGGLDPAPDMILCQNVSQLKAIPESYLSRTIARLGGNMNFIDQPAGHVAELRRLIGLTGAAVTTNYYLYEQAAASGCRHVALIPNGIDLEQWRPDQRAAVERPFTAGFVGNITSPAKREYKGYDLVVDACRRAGIRLRRATLGRFQIPHDQMMKKFYHEIDVLIHPTLGEGCSNTLMEAAACGVPIITTRTAGYHGEQMVNHHDVLFCDRTPASIYEQLMAVYADAALEAMLRTNVRRFAETHHNIRDIVARIRRVVYLVHQHAHGGHQP
jgi:glycosyltransferase involved in cell wall biosynthesis